MTWFFGSTSYASGLTTLRSSCGAPNCTSLESEGQGWGVRGIADDANGTGVYGLHDAGSGTNAGVYGLTHSSADGAVAVQGIVAPYGAPGANSAAVLGINTSTDYRSIGVWGTQYGSGWGVYGSTSGAGVGVYGLSAGATGVYGRSNGEGSGAHGVYGYAPNGQGVYGVSGAATSYGVRGFGGTGTGVYGSASSGTGGLFNSSTGDGLHATTSNSHAYALATGGGSFGSAYIDGSLDVTGTCCTLVGTDAGTRRMVAVEATQHIFSDEGTASLVNGRAVIPMDPLFAQAANPHEDYQVFLTPHSADTAGLAAVKLSATGFEVRELNGGQGSFKFSWRVDALRQGYEQARMEPSGGPGGPAPARRWAAAPG